MIGVRVPTLCGVVLLFFVVEVQAITLDTFETSQQVVAVAPAGSASSSVAGSGVVGGTRSLLATATGGSGNLTFETTPFAPHRLKHSQDDSVTGTSMAHWDGDLNPNAIDPTGLNGVDLTQDGGDAIVLEDLNFDHAFGSDLLITITLYDVSDATGQTYSSSSVLIEEAVIGLDLMFPYASFLDHGPSGPVDLTQVGAISLFIDGSEQGIDTSFRLFGTNGSCPLIPDTSGNVLDECGECLAPDDPLYNQSCADCLGVPNGPSLPGTACDTGLTGLCGEGQYSQECLCVPIFDPGPEFCDGVDNDCDGDVDEPFPLLGQLCGAQGEGKCKIEGIFICSPEGDLKCDVDINFDELEGCDIIIGCDGVPGSGLVPDKCGVCGGDGSFCEDCESLDQTDTLVALDGGAKAQERLIRRITRGVKRATTRGRVLRWVKGVREEAHALQIRNWVLSWILPQVSTQCPESEFCVTLSNASTLSEYRDGSEQLRQLALQSIRKLRKVTRSRASSARFRRQANKKHDKNMTLADSVAVTYNRCTFG